MKKTIEQSDCPVCGYHFSSAFIQGEMPLATIAWPKSEDEAKNMKRLPLDFMQCLRCSHIYNKSFCYDDVPYSEKPNLMFNQGAVWKGFIADIVQHLADSLPENPTVVEIGHGDGSFISALSETRGRGNFVGFDPNGAASGADRVQFCQELFDPFEHLAEYKPDLIVMRHIVEHLDDPLSFLQSFTVAADLEDCSPRFYIETPCIDKVLTSGRTVDFYYEHNNQFTTRSFARLFEESAFTVDEIQHGYDGEVIYAHAHIMPSGQYKQRVEQSSAFLKASSEAIPYIHGQIKEFLAQNKSIAVWGGTGKSAAFMNRYRLDSSKIAVVDSDPDKHGTFVPGMGQQIMNPLYLIERPVDIVIIPPQWRARDITIEMEKKGIKASLVLIEGQGRLMSYTK
jgi:hypothetical protein